MEGIFKVKLIQIGGSILEKMQSFKNTITRLLKNWRNNQLKGKRNIMIMKAEKLIHMSKNFEYVPSFTDVNVGDTMMKQIHIDVVYNPKKET